jgi:hypothetical protein
MVQLHVVNDVSAAIVHVSTGEQVAVVLRARPAPGTVEAVASSWPNAQIVVVPPTADGQPVLLGAAGGLTDDARAAVHAWFEAERPGASLCWSNATTVELVAQSLADGQAPDDDVCALHGVDRGEVLDTLTLFGEAP